MGGRSSEARTVPSEEVGSQDPHSQPRGLLPKAEASALPSVLLRVMRGWTAFAQGGTRPQALTCHHWGRSPIGGSSEPQGPGPFSLFWPGCRPPEALVSHPTGVCWAAPDSAGNPQHGAQTATPVPDGRGPPRASLGPAGAVLPAP